MIAVSTMFQTSTGIKTFLDFGNAFCIVELEFVSQGEFMRWVMTILLIMHEAIKTQSVVSTSLAQNISHNTGYSQ